MNEKLRISDLEKMFIKQYPKNIAQLVSDSKKRVGDNITNDVIYMDTLSLNDKDFLKSNKGKDFFSYIKQSSKLKPDYYGSKSVLLSNFFKDIGFYNNIMDYLRNIFFKQNFVDLNLELQLQELEKKGGDEFLEQKYFPYLGLEFVADIIEIYNLNLKEDLYKKSELFNNIIKDKNIDNFLIMFENFNLVINTNYKDLLKKVDEFFHSLNKTLELDDIIKYFELSELKEFLNIFHKNKINKI